MLQALGQVDFGLYGLIGGLTVFLGLINHMMHIGVGRFYAVSVGKIEKSSELGLLECQKWFTAGVVIHTVLPIFLIIVGYPLGQYVVECFLNIPQDRIVSCVWVWRFVCLSCFAGMISVPYHAMYVAKQEIAELTIYSFCTTTLNVLALYYMVEHPSDWLVKYALWVCLINVIPQAIIIIRAVFKYDECRFRWKYAYCWQEAKAMFLYSSWSLIGTIADMFNNQGMNILVNKYFGPNMNSAMSISNSVSGHCNTLSSSLVSAFWPAIMNAYGAGRLDDMRLMAYRLCKVGTLLVLMFSIPLSIEIDEVLRLWLKNPPPYTGGICIFIVMGMVFDKIGYGFPVVAQAIGKVAKYQTVSGIVSLIGLPIALAFAAKGCSVYYVGFAIALTKLFCCVSKVAITYKDVMMSISFWLKSIILPLFLLSLVAVLFGIMIRDSMQPNLFRIIMTTGACESAMFVMAWLFLFDLTERNYIKNALKRLINRLR